MRKINLHRSFQSEIEFPIIDLQNHIVIFVLVWQLKSLIIRGNTLEMYFPQGVFWIKDAKNLLMKKKSKVRNLI